MCIRDRDGHRPHHDAVEEKRTGGAGHVVAEDREPVSERVPAATVAQNTGHTDDYRRDQDDEPDDDDHDALLRITGCTSHTKRRRRLIVARHLDDTPHGVAQLATVCRYR